MNTKNIAVALGLLGFGLFLDAAPASASIYDVPGSTNFYVNGSSPTCPTNFIVVGSTCIPNQQSIIMKLGTIQSVITGYYLTILERAPDQSGLDYWTNTVIAEQNTLDQVKYFLAQSEVDLLYSTILKRAPDASGEAYWIGTLVNGTNSGATVRAYFQQAAAGVGIR